MNQNNESTSLLQSFASASVGCTDFSFQELDDDGLLSGAPTRYGRHLIGRWATITALLRDGVSVTHPAVIITEAVYAQIGETND